MSDSKHTNCSQISSLSYPGRIQIKREETSKQTPNIIKCSSRTLLNPKEIREKSEQKRDVDVITHTTETSAINSDAVESKMQTFSLPKISQGKLTTFEETNTSEMTEAMSESQKARTSKIEAQEIVHPCYILNFEHKFLTNGLAVAYDKATSTTRILGFGRGQHNSTTN
ncbi:uncharacterized protein LOC111636645 [Centruroides sculpturatus]|uniref:uncharacterized protein LOC111636645 n=1 Tax=Centruroides sculpturatus TaxID=218467 RepID=UPI000C6D19F1|nr:uncharacterized protein LOC111636645 [Centruroides sculpturatus]